MNTPEVTTEFGDFILFMFFSEKDMFQSHRTTGIFIYFIAGERNVFCNEELNRSEELFINHFSSQGSGCKGGGDPVSKFL